MQYPGLEFDKTGLTLRFFLGAAIGILQGSLARVFKVNVKIPYFIIQAPPDFFPGFAQIPLIMLNSFF